MTTPSGVAIGLLGAGVLYLLNRSKENKDELEALKKRPAAPPVAPAESRHPTEIAPEPAPEPYVYTPDPSVPPLETGPFPRHGAAPWHGPAHASPAYPPAPAPYPQPQAPYPPRGAAHRVDGAPWVRATQADVSRDGTMSWYLELLNSSHPAGYTEQRTVGGRRWKLLIVSAATHPELTQHARDVLGWVLPLHAVARPAPPRPRPPMVAAYPHAAPPSQHPYALTPPRGAQPPAYVAPVPYPAPQQVPYPAYGQPAPHGGGGAPPPHWPAAGHPGTHAHGAPASTPATTGSCTNWRPATDEDVHRDGVATVYHAMLSQPETTPARIEVHKGRTWKFQVVTPQSDPSFGFAPGVTKSVRGWVCADLDPSDPGY